MNLDPQAAALLADVILAGHVGVVAFVVLGEVAILLGGALGWNWIRRRALRIAHVALMVFIALQAWLGQTCPLTIWEQSLRRTAGQDAYSQGFIEHWLARLLYVEAPWWAFLAAYTLFALLVLATWIRVPPHPRGAARR